MIVLNPPESEVSPHARSLYKDVGPFAVHEGFIPGQVLVLCEGKSDVSIDMVLGRSGSVEGRGFLAVDRAPGEQDAPLVQLVRPQDLPASWNPLTDHRISVWEVALQLARVLSAENGGIEATAKLMAAAGSRSEVDVESVQQLAYRLYEMAQKSRPDDARLFNLLGGSWSDLTEAAGRVRLGAAVQGSFDFGGDD